MTNEAAIETLQAMLDAMDPRFLTWDREQRKVEALSMAIVLLKKEVEYVKRNSISTEKTAYLCYGRRVQNN